MIMVEERVESAQIEWRAKLKAYVELLKLRLSVIVGFSGAIGYLLAAQKPYDFGKVLLFTISGLLITGAANATNQVLEVELDKLMKRTGTRPLPSGRLSKKNAQIFIAALLFFGLTIQTVYFNPLTAAISFFSYILYGYVYTPLKRVGPIAVFVGAIPGGLPPLIGWVASSGLITLEALIIFAIQFVWQFPHFWAIAWVLDEDYKKAGFRLLPLNNTKSLETALLVMLFTMVLLPLSILPTQLGLTGLVAAWIATISGIVFLYLNYQLVKNGSDKAALRLMFGSFIYLPIVQIAYVLDKI
ncbi:heme o synthase [Nibrella saemangeumensis]|uniref:Protoheme IX farnesyltransferase n=1 Tax=Nibrella saemangeumensis TaxID=1084526 RepID=A0ABP8NP11_9BACT